MYDQYQLFYQAIVEGKEHSWTRIYDDFFNQVAWWVQKNNAYWVSAEDVNFFANGAFIKFYEAMTPEKFLNVIPDLPTALSYLRNCVASVVIDYVRTQARTEQTESLENISAKVMNNHVHDLEAKIGDQLDAETLWQTVFRLANEENEILVLQALFIQGMKPREIYETYPLSFDCVNQVYRTREKFLKRLRRHSELLH